MKHQYFGDVNDYVKYGLLRCFSQAGFRLGVCWMLTPDDGRTDGGKVRYLSLRDEWWGHDPELFDHLSRTLAAPDGRHVRHIEGRTHIPGARFFGAVVPDARAERARWFGHMLAALDGADLLFFDPDNGVEVPSKALGQKDSSKYVYWNELAESWNRAQSLLVFQYFPRVCRDAYIAARVGEMKSRLPGSLVMPLCSANVLYLLAYRAAGAGRVAAVVASIAARWSGRVWRHDGV
jgi:hypothetical protein